MKGLFNIYVLFNTSTLGPLRYTCARTYKTVNGLEYEDFFFLIYRRSEVACSTKRNEWEEFVSKYVLWGVKTKKQVTDCFYFDWLLLLHWNINTNRNVIEEVRNCFSWLIRLECINCLLPLRNLGRNCLKRRNKCSGVFLNINFAKLVGLVNWSDLSVKIAYFLWVILEEFVERADEKKNCCLFT